MLRYLLSYKPFVWLLLIVNIFGTAYGYWWYKSQLANTPTLFLPFVPDSPTASLFFCIFLLFYLLNRHVPLFEALAIMTLFKYGIWAVVMNLLTLNVTGHLSWQGYMLIASHGAMAIQGILYAPFYKIRPIHIVLAGIWTLHNDIIDYVFGMMPVYSQLHQFSQEIGYFTFWLSLLSIAITYWLTINKKDQVQ